MCNPGTSGNPYEGCGPQEKSCVTTACGARAECRQGVNNFDCVCPVGYTGNPYVQCEGNEGLKSLQPYLISSFSYHENSQVD